MVLTITQNQRPDWIDIHNLKMIKYGSSFYIDCDLTLPCYYTIGQGHDACLALKSAIERDFPIVSRSLYTQILVKRDTVNIVKWKSVSIASKLLSLHYILHSTN